MKEQNTETYNTNPDEKKSTKFDPHDFPKEEKEEVKTATDEQKQYQILLNIASTGTSEELFNYIHSIELEAKKEAKQEFEQKLNQAIIELREKIIKN